MDLLSMLMNAKIRDMDGGEIGDVIGIHIGGGKLVVTVDDEIEFEEDEDDPDGGEEIDGDGEELDDVEEVPKPTPLRAVAGGKK